MYIYLVLKQHKYISEGTDYILFGYQNEKSAIDKIEELNLFSRDDYYYLQKVKIY